jgi:hypothetical protein
MRVVLGVLIALWPLLLPWRVATASILAGSAILMMAFVMRGVGGCSDGVMVVWAGALSPSRGQARR